jgi:hypothetical protein
MPHLLSGDAPLQPITTQGKSIPSGSMNPSKIKVCVIRN